MTPSPPGQGISAFFEQLGAGLASKGAHSATAAAPDSPTPAHDIPVSSTLGKLALEALTAARDDAMALVAEASAPCGQVDYAEALARAALIQTETAQAVVCALLNLAENTTVNRKATS